MTQVPSLNCLNTLESEKNSTVIEIIVSNLIFAGSDVTIYSNYTHCVSRILIFYTKNKYLDAITRGGKWTNFFFRSLN